MKIDVALTVALTDKQAHHVFEVRLAQLTADMWVDGDKVMEEAYTSHRFDQEVGAVTDPKLLVIVAACRLRAALKRAKDAGNVMPESGPWFLTKEAKTD